MWHGYAGWQQCQSSYLAGVVHRDDRGNCDRERTKSPDSDCAVQRSLWFLDPWEVLV